MANEPEYGRIQRLYRFCGLALVVLMTVGLVYLAPLAVLARIEDPNGGNRFLGSKTYIPRAFTDEAKNWQSAPNEWESTQFYFYQHSFLNTLYSPVLNAAGGNRNEQSKIAKFILGFQ